MAVVDFAAGMTAAHQVVTDVSHDGSFEFSPQDNLNGPPSPREDWSYQLGEVYGQSEVNVDQGHDIKASSTVLFLSNVIRMRRADDQVRAGN